jgi:pectin methylesterase-like acyl-CoA thioesterase
MRPARSFTFSCLALIALVALTGQAFSSTVVVGTCKSGLTQFTTIGAAITAVPAGSTIDVCPNTYAEQVIIVSLRRSG